MHIQACGTCDGGRVHAYVKMGKSHIICPYHFVSLSFIMESIVAFSTHDLLLCVIVTFIATVVLC